MAETLFPTLTGYHMCSRHFKAVLANKSNWGRFLFQKLNFLEQTILSTVVILAAYIFGCVRGPIPGPLDTLPRCHSNSLPDDFLNYDRLKPLFSTLSTCHMYFWLCGLEYGPISGPLDAPPQCYSNSLPDRFLNHGSHGTGYSTIHMVTHNIVT